MTLLSLGLLSLWACGDKSLESDTDPTSQPASEPSSLPSDDPIIEEELEPLEAIAVGFEYVGTWDQNSASLGGWVFDSGEDADAYMQVHVTNIDYFSEGAGTDNKNICTMLATFVNQPAILDVQEYPWDNPPSSAGQYPLSGAPAPVWQGFEGYLTFLGFSNATVDTCARINDPRVLSQLDDGTVAIGFEGMHFGISFGPLTTGHIDRLEEAYADDMEWFEANRNAFVTQFIHMNHLGDGTEYDFTGYDWNYAVLAKMNEDNTVTTVSCDPPNEDSDCYDFVEDQYDSSLNVFSLSNSWWYEDFPNLDFDILNLGVPEMNTDPEPADAHVRVVHLSPDAPSVDVYANGTAVGVNDVSFPAGSAYLTVPAGDYTFEVAPTGTSYEDVVPVGLSATLEAGVSYTAIAHGYLDPANGSNVFAITPFVTDRSEVTEGTFRLQVVHAAAADAFAQVDIWNITDADNPAALIEDFDYGASVTTELPTGIAFVLGVDVDNDATPEATFNIPDSLTGVVSVYAVNDTAGVPFLFAHLDDGTTVQIDAN